MIRLPIAEPANTNGLHECLPHRAKLSATSCASRWRKAQEYPGDGALDHCRRCEDGKRHAEPPLCG